MAGTTRHTAVLPWHVSIAPPPYRMDLAVVFRKNGVLENHRYAVVAIQTQILRGYTFDGPEGGTPPVVTGTEDEMTRDSWSPDPQGLRTTSTVLVLADRGAGEIILSAEDVLKTGDIIGHSVIAHYGDSEREDHELAKLFAELARSAT